jgi:hypothetical protein
LQAIADNASSATRLARYAVTSAWSYGDTSTVGADDRQLVRAPTDASTAGVQSVRPAVPVPGPFQVDQIHVDGKTRRTRPWRSRTPR